MNRWLASFPCLLLLFGGLLCTSGFAGEGALIAPVPARTPAIRAERLPVADGAELTTFFAQPGPGIAGGDIPIVSFLRDDLGGNPDGGRLRQVWILTYRPPSLLQRMSAVLPFPLWHWRVHVDSMKPPKPMLDAAAPYHRAIRAVIGTAFRSLVVDPSGLSARATTVSYEGNIEEYRRLHLFEALSALQEFGSQGDADTTVSPTGLQRVESRLVLSDRPFGALVSERKLVEFHRRDRTQLEENRGANWDLLRQKAEMNGLYFQPIHAPGAEATEALLWISSDDLAADAVRPEPHSFDGSFLGISDPWTDPKLWNWDGYSEMWELDAAGRRVEPGARGVHDVRMIPLAMYSLDHRHSPFLLVDFRDASRVKRDEVGRRVIEDVPRAVLGFALFGNWQYRVASGLWNFVRGRHGAAVDRTFRTRAYAEARWHLLLNSGLNPALRTELAQRLDKLSLNPLRQNRQAEAQLARRQYAALVAYAENPLGLQARLERDRRAEMTHLVHGPTARLLFTTASCATLGLYRHREPGSQALLDRLEQHRRLEASMQFVREALAASPRVDMVSNMDELRSAVEEISSAGADSAHQRARLLGRLVLQTSGDAARADFLAALHGMDDVASEREMAQLSRNPALPEKWRDSCRSYMAAVTQPGACEEPCAASDTDFSPALATVDDAFIEEP